jgi:hypothetical protein
MNDLLHQLFEIAPPSDRHIMAGASQHEVVRACEWIELILCAVTSPARIHRRPCRALFLDKSRSRWGSQPSNPSIHKRQRTLYSKKHTIP